MGVEDILLEAAAECENEYDEDEFEEEKKKEGVTMSLKKAAQVIDKEHEFDARESLKSSSRIQQEPVIVVDSSRDDYDVNRDESIEEKLRKADAKIQDPSAEEKTEEKVEDTESEYDSDEDDSEYEDSKDFLFCCYRRRIDEIYRHLERGASIRTKDRHGWSPLHWVCAKGYDDVLEVLLNFFRDRNVKKYINQKDLLQGFTPLHLACVGAHIECIKILFDHSAKRLKNNIGELPIDVVGVNISSASGRKIAKMFGIKVEDVRQPQEDEAKRSNGGARNRK